MSTNELNDIASELTPGEPKMENVAVKTPLDYLLIAAQTFLVLSFLANLAVIVAAYCILPGEIHVCYYRFGEASLCLESTSSFLLRIAVGPLIIFIIAFVCWAFPPNPKRKPIKSMGYWNREENVVLKWKIGKLWMTLLSATAIYVVSVVLFRFLRGYGFAPLFQGNFITTEVYGKIHADSCMTVIIVLALSVLIFYFWTLNIVKNWERVDNHDTQSRLHP